MICNEICAAPIGSARCLAGTFRGTSQEYVVFHGAAIDYCLTIFGIHLAFILDSPALTLDLTAHVFERLMDQRSAWQENEYEEEGEGGVGAKNCGVDTL